MSQELEKFYKIGKKFSIILLGFSYEGEVKGGRQSGWGIEKYGARTQRYGQFLDGKTIGYCVADMKGVFTNYFFIFCAGMMYCFKALRGSKRGKMDTCVMK